jgi:outer membrane protein OmpA-like peptidoglycan-associated protein
MLAAATAMAFSLSAHASPQTATIDPSDAKAMFRLTEVSRTVEAVNYQHRSGATDVDFAGTTLLPTANGKAKVRSKRGTMEVESEFANLQAPTTFGGEYLTYVLWAISPEGRATNLGEVIVGDNARSKLTATTQLQAFALIVTAEPYYAVVEPSNLVVLENIVRADTRGTSEPVNAKYELMERGGYLPTGYNFDPVVLSANLPLEFYEARNALRIAKSEGAEAYANESYQHAAQLMKNADDDATTRHGDKRQLIADSRQAVQTAEDAREIAVKKIAEKYEQMRAANSAAEVSAAQANSASAQAESDRSRADMIANKAAAAAAVNDAQLQTAKAQADMAANQTTSAAAVSAAQNDANQARLSAQQAQDAEQRAITDKATMRAQLVEQLNMILQTRDTARGLIISMSDVLFDSGKFSLKPGAREKLAKVAGILIAYPGLNIAVGGYTDNVGGDGMNQTLSQNRAGSVRSYLVEQGVANGSVTAQGFGNSSPVASNDNSAGRQENRRVELVVSGDLIGVSVNATTSSLR